MGERQPLPKPPAGPRLTLALGETTSPQQIARVPGPRTYGTSRLNRHPGPSRSDQEWAWHCAKRLPRSPAARLEHRVPKRKRPTPREAGPPLRDPTLPAQPTAHGRWRLPPVDGLAVQDADVLTALHLVASDLPREEMTPTFLSRERFRVSFLPSGWPTGEQQTEQSPATAAHHGWKTSATMPQVRVP